MNTARCGHGEYDKGHCGTEGCPNDWRVCPDCCPTVQAKAREDARRMWNVAFGHDPA